MPAFQPVLLDAIGGPVILIGTFLLLAVAVTGVVLLVVFLNKRKKK
ncbi:MAG: hypothetical protein FD123_962 [Bacteroidetes bacterium]|nr:MAG: hypothetical protein FD123_962 [Bacteroidota bacterium]